MSTSNRVTRSASRAASEGAPSRATTPARASRQSTPARARATSPAVADDEAKSKPVSSNKSNRAYGTAGSVAPMEPAKLGSVLGDGDLGVVDEEDEDDLGNHPAASTTSSQRLRDERKALEDGLGKQRPASISSSQRLRDERETLEHETQRRLRDERDDREQETRERMVDSLAGIPEITIERPSIFSRLFWAPFGKRQQAPAIRIANPVPLPDLMQPDAEVVPPRPLFILGQSSLASMVGLLLTTTLLFAFTLFTFEIFYGPVLNPLLFNPINHTSIIPTGTVQQLLHATSHDYDRLNRRIGRIEQQFTKSPVPVDLKPKKQINWFAPGFNAFIDDQLTSPTAAICNKFWSPWPWGYLFGESCPEEPLSDGPMQALKSWDDAGRDRWCAPKNPFGKLQLTVAIERPITPTELVVEMAAKDAVPVGHVKTYPKEIELWIQVPDDNIRRSISSMIDQSYPDLWRDVSTQGRELAMAQTLDYNYVPVGRWKYNVHINEEVQTFRIPVPLAEYGVTTSKVAVRVNTNWGNDEFTCVNRFVLHGDDASGIREHLEELED
ncbi:hypothetical protein P7C71_g1386, partial [Lecanoromycetidae sp. Uapishka_2]